MVEQLDAEMDERLRAITDTAEDGWEGFRQRCHAFLEMALEPQIQRIVLRDARAVLGGGSPEAQQQCVESMRKLIHELIVQGVIVEADAQALASLLYGSLAEAAAWIAEAEEGAERLAQASVALDLLLRGVLKSQLPDEQVTALLAWDKSSKSASLLKSNRAPTAERLTCH